MSPKCLFKLCLFNLVFFIALNVSCQIPMETWQGNFGQSDIMIQPQKIILELSKTKDSLLTGATHLYYSKGKYEHYKVNATFNSRDSIYTISEDSVLSFKLMFGAERSAGTYKMKLSIRDTIYTLLGEWKTHSRILFKYRTVPVWFSKKNDSPLLIKKIDDNSLIIKKDTALERHSDIQSLIEIDSKNTDSVKLEIYDNGILDNDSISLYFDDILILSKQRISTAPIILSISPKKLKSISKLKLVAESMGTIPPCTAIMIIKISNKRYEVNLSSNFENNGVVEFFLKE